MISADLRFEGFDATSWTNLISLFAPTVVERMTVKAPISDDPTVEQGTPEQRTGMLCVVTDAKGLVLKALHTTRGRVTDIRGTVTGADLPGLRKTYAVQRCVLVEEGCLEELSEQIALRLQRGDDYLTQLLLTLRCVLELQKSNRFVLYPNPLQSVLIPSPGTVRRAIDVLLPDDHCAVAMLWKGQQPWTSIALRRRAGNLDWVAGPDHLLRWTGPLGGDWRRDYRIVTDAVAKHAAPVHFGIYGEEHTIRSLLRNPDPGAWTKAVAVRDLIIHPTPAYIAVALGTDAMRAATKLASEALGGMDLFGLLSPVAFYLRGRVDEVTSITQTLGFNPLAVLARSLDEPGDSGSTNDEVDSPPERSTPERSTPERSTPERST
ncbi:MAG: hypothetical protein AAF550_10670 [Myxococcota bacterium]